MSGHFPAVPGDIEPGGTTPGNPGAATSGGSTVTIITVPVNGFIGVAYSQTLAATGGTPPYTWTATAGLPTGLTLTTAGVLSGTPTALGVFSFTLTATDSLSNVGTLLVKIVISNLFAPSTVPATIFPYNILSPADSDSESSTGYTWASYSNASTPTRSNTVSVTGLDSTQWSVPVSNTSQIATAQYPVQQNLPYIASAYFLTTTVRSISIGIAFYNGGGGLISLVQSTPVLTSPSAWQPLTLATVAPNSAASASLVITSYGTSLGVPGATAGDLYWIDLAFMAQSPVQVLVDWNNPPFALGSSAGQSFMDVSPLVRLDTGVNYTRGRQDMMSDVQGGSASFSLQNDQGQFAQLSNVSLPSGIGGTVSLQSRCQINFADEKGQWWTRFDGPISEIAYDFDNIGGTSVANVTVTDALASLSRQDSLFSWTKEQILFNGPTYHWSLDDAGATGGAGVAAETSGNNGPAMRLVSSDSTNTALIGWQDSSGGIETLADAASSTGSDGSVFWSAGMNQPSTPLRGLISGNVGPFTSPVGSVAFTPKGLTSGSWVAGSQSAQNTFVGNTGYMLEASLPTPIAPTSFNASYSLEAWFMPDPSIALNLSKNYGPFVVLGLGSSTSKANLLAGIYLNAGTATFEVASYNQPPSFLGLNWPGTAPPAATSSVTTTWTADTNKRPHHLVIGIIGDPATPTVEVWLDGVNIGAFVLPVGQTYDTITVGGAYGGCGTFFGNISMVSVYPYPLSQNVITQDCQLGQYGMWESTTDDCVATLGNFASVPGFWSNLSAAHAGLTMTEYFDITGSNALSAMQQYEAAEKGLLFVNAQGQLTFHARSWREGYGAPDLFLPPGAFDAALQYQLVDQFMVNEAGVAGPNTLGAKATTTLQNLATGQTQTQTSTSTVIQAGYINTASQAQYGVYATNPVSSPLSLPLITWSRGYAALGLPSYTYWTDPHLTDYAAWDANSRGVPWVLPASLTIDLLTFEAENVDAYSDPVGISSFYALEIDNMIAPSPGTLPASFPSTQLSLEWFIEGITENYTLSPSGSQRTIQFYTSPAQYQRAWIPGDSTYGVLGSTTRLGISSADLSATQADGKDVSHDGGPPYWPPTFSAAMNDTTGMGKGFVGARDLRGIAANLQQMLQPPLCVVTATSQTQSFTNGGLTGTSPPNTAQMFWDVVHADTASGMGAIAGYPNWYLVTVPGWYEIDASVSWSLTASGLQGYAGQSWIVVAQAAAQALAAGTGNPLTVNQYVCPVGEAVRFNGASMSPICAPTTRMYLGLGDMVAIACEQNYTSSRGTSTAGSGSMMSIRFTGLGRVDDRTEINTSLGTGGTVSLVSHGTLQQATFLNTHTYSYQGKTGWNPNARRNTDAGCYQGVKGPQDSEGSQASQIAFNTASIISALTGHTILSATLTCANVATYYSTGAKLMLGTTNVTPGNASFNAPGSWTTTDVMHQHFNLNQTLTFNISVSIVKSIVTGGALALVLGNGTTTDFNYYGEWAGGPGNWTLTVNYV